PARLLEGVLCLGMEAQGLERTAERLVGARVGRAVPDLLAEFIHGRPVPALSGEEEAEMRVGAGEATVPAQGLAEKRRSLLGGGRRKERAEVAQDPRLLRLGRKRVPVSLHRRLDGPEALVDLAQVPESL